MGRPSSGEIVPYQWLLRAIGAYLDAEHARRAQIMELPEGFAVRYDTGGDVPDLRLRKFTYEELLQFRSQMEAARGRKDVPPGAYQDFLRTLGYELEQAGAYLMLLDEIEDDFLITYQYLNPSESFVPHKHLSVINRELREDLLQRARTRRQMPGRKSLFKILDRG